MNARRPRYVMIGAIAIAVACLVLGVVIINFTPWERNKYMDDFGRAYGILEEERFRETDWDGWSRADRDIIGAVTPHITANEGTVRIMWRIDDGRNGFSITAVVFYRIQRGSRREQLIVPPTGGNVFHVTMSEALDVTNIVLSTRRF